MHANSILIGLRLIPLQKSSYRLLRRFLHLYSCLETSLECPAVVVSQHCCGPFSIVSLFHSCDIFTKMFIMFITNYHTTVDREEIQMGMKEVVLRILKTLSLLFASMLSRGNVSCRYRKAGEVRSMAFTKFFMRPDVKGW